jgi:hypothetical protein
MSADYTLQLWNNDPLSVETLIRMALKRVGAQGPDQSHPLRLELEASLTLALMFQRKFNDARNRVQAILENSPHSEQALWCEAQLAFFLEDPLPAAWSKLEARFGLLYTGDRPFDSARLWDGSPLTGRSILLAGEGGFGDQIQFVRFVSALKDAGAGRVIVSADPRLIPLLRSVHGADAFVPTSPPSNTLRDPAEYDVGIPMISVPSRLGSTLASLRATVPYLSASAESVDEARRRIDARPGRGLNAGLCWQAGKRWKTIPLELLRPLANIPGVRLFGLGERPLIEGECANFPMANLGSNDIASTAGSIAALDLVITVDTMVAHLAGSLGKPVWLLLNYLPDWRWPLHGETTPWYPSMRLFRQEARNWEGPIRNVARALAAIA